ncbi:MAG TPA: flagellar protein [Sulfitobacter sp.]|uniref:flagellin N-terminal helical domain-containing protein n=1 Tax=Sulfitobacter dubius TaxID=218673 RepID=UPI000C5A3505|nr:flagellar protein [Sulfitobacter sp.]HBB83622.1 flagellar protein [Sulfitobacter sp.]
MSSINTNTSAMNALATLRNVNSSLNQTQDRISTGLKVSSGKDNAAYFAISETMKGDSGMTKAVNESLTLTKNSLATARVGADSVKDLAVEFGERVAFAQASGSDIESIKVELDEIVKRMGASISQATFNGDDLISAANTTTTAASVDATTGELTEAVMENAPKTMNVVTGLTREGGTFGTTEMEVKGVDLKEIHLNFKAIADNLVTNYNAETSGVPDLDDDEKATYLENTLKAAEGLLDKAVSAATTLGVGEKSIENQQEFLTKLADNLDSGVGAMVDANMEEEAARLQALQVQQQLASQSLSIANQAPQNILSLFR